MGETVAFDIAQDGNNVTIAGDDIAVKFAVEGIELPPAIDASFAVWGLLSLAMAEGFNLKINRPIDPRVAHNAECLSRIWEMWVPSRFRSISVSGAGKWSRARRTDLSDVHLYSGGVDSTFALLELGVRPRRGHVATVFGLDYRRDGDEGRFAKLIAKTDPLLEKLNHQRIIVRTDANRQPQKLTHGFTLAACLFLLSDIFEGGTIAADLTHAEDMVAFPWGTNHITNPYFAGSDFAMRTVGANIGRTEKLAAIAANSAAVPFLSCCRQEKIMPSNCGICSKCIRTKAMFIAATGNVPDIFVDNTFGERLMAKLDLSNRFERAELFDLYCYAEERGVLSAIPGLTLLVERLRHETGQEGSASP